MPITFNGIQISGGVQFVPEAEEPLNIILQLNFNGANGATTTTDSSSYANPVTLTSATINTTQSVEGGSSLLQGTQNSFFNVNGVQTLGTEDFTLTGWARTTSTVGGQGQIVLLSYPLDNSTYTNFGLVVTIEPSPLRFGFTYRTPANTTVTVNNNELYNLSLNTWYKWTLLRDAGTLKFYRENNKLYEVPSVTTNYTQTTWRSAYTTTVGGNRRSLVGFQDQIQIIKGKAVYPT